MSSTNKEMTYFAPIRRSPQISILELVSQACGAYFCIVSGRLSMLKLTKKKNFNKVGIMAVERILSNIRC
jgi:hypothetical protein